MIDRDIFEDLFILELANNHWGRLDRGIRIVQEFSRIVRFNNSAGHDQASNYAMYVISYIKTSENAQIFVI